MTYSLMDGQFDRFIQFLYSNSPELYWEYQHLVISPRSKHGKVRIDQEKPIHEKDRRVLERILAEFYAAVYN